jgi:tRNA pseudouridine13 synthase
MFDLNFPHAFPITNAHADFRSMPADFVVNEDLGFDLAGSGQHYCFLIEKQGQNTVWVAKQLAGIAGVKLVDVGYCGLKDRHAMTRQWFSVAVNAKKTLDPAAVIIEGVNILDVIRHDKKLRPGMHRGNQFVIRLRNVEGDASLLTQRFERVCQQGVPNYFGEQRFGRAAGNLELAVTLQNQHPSVWRDRQYQFALSAIRSWLFNTVLAARVANGTWQECVAGEPMELPTGPLWGRGRLASTAELQDMEKTLLAPFPEWQNILEHTGVQQERRALKLMPSNGRQHWEGGDWVVTFDLPPGTYATCVLRELLQTVSKV